MALLSDRRGFLKGAAVFGFGAAVGHRLPDWFAERDATQFQHRDLVVDSQGRPVMDPNDLAKLGSDTRRFTFREDEKGLVADTNFRIRLNDKNRVAAVSTGVIPVSVDEPKVTLDGSSDHRVTPAALNDGEGRIGQVVTGPGYDILDHDERGKLSMRPGGRHILQTNSSGDMGPHGIESVATPVGFWAQFRAGGISDVDGNPVPPDKDLFVPAHYVSKFDPAPQATPRPAQTPSPRMSISPPAKKV